MVNWVKVQRKLLGRLAKNAGLRQRAVVADDAGTVMNFWAPDQDKKMKKKKASNKEEKHRHAVVLLHGFAGDGIVTWGFQVGTLARRYDVYVPDLLHFGGSTSPSPDRSTGFQARCVAAALGKLGVEGRCTVVGFSYGGLVAFAMAEACPGLVRSVVVSGTALAYTDAMNDALLGRLGARALPELMLPETVERLRSLFSAAIHMKVWFPSRLMKDFLKVMYTNRNERAEMLEAMVARDKEASAPVFQQNDILLLWGENDNFFPIEDAKRLREELGDKATLRSISKAGHLAHLERPCIYNRCLKEFLAHVNAVSS